MTEKTKCPWGLKRGTKMCIGVQCHDECLR